MTFVVYSPLGGNRFVVSVFENNFEVMCDQWYGFKINSLSDNNLAWFNFFPILLIERNLNFTCLLLIHIA